MDGILKQSVNITHWQGQYVPFAFQNSRLSMVVQGATDMIFHSPARTGVIDGSGQAWWAAFIRPFFPQKKSSSTLRPILWTVANSTRVTFDGIEMINSPMWCTHRLFIKFRTLMRLLRFNLVASFSYINYYNMNISAVTTSSSAPIKNTDGFEQVSPWNGQRE
ncbi:hypothetical protein PIIN_10742 [Serendipita indica DSM 11827]|uniref:galacturonan 1,4-alpha-galacturonidase n=1 Tax=Serendipita indica (strain DSM 11827) TaxID=1109443 RepID=G4TZL1_SERID|nr:hypothetical protein PIIN_10742 [Serendipita indica DSM 11827]